MKKIAFLILTLAIPVSIFLILKLFGRNTFEVPVLYEEGIPGCEYASAPHLVPDLQYVNEHGENAHIDELSGYLVFAYLDVKMQEKTGEQLVEIVRIQDAFFEIGSPNFVLLIPGDSADLITIKSLCDDMGLEQNNRSLALVEKNGLDEFLECGIALIAEDKSLDNLVLVDDQKRIRGQYNSLDVKETDRLILELKILKKEE